MEHSFLFQALVFLIAAVLCVPIAKKLGMGSVLGYLIAGIILGPFVLGFIGAEGEDILHASEFGVVMLLFIIGLELDPKEFWGLRKAILGFGSLQVFGTSLLLFLCFIYFFNWSVNLSIAVSLSMALSSTAIILQTLKEKGISNTIPGQASFSILIFQDIMVIPILAILPLLAIPGVAPATTNHTLISGLPGYAQTFVVFGVIGLVYVVTRFVVTPLLNLIVKVNLKEVFVAAALTIVIGVSYAMTLVGLSPALGAFLAGIVLATTEYRHSLESTIEPFKGLLLGLFFIAVGSTINFGIIASKPVEIVSMVLGVMIVKGIVIFAIGKLFKMSFKNNILTALLLSQVGEFAFVLLNFSTTLHILDKSTFDLLMAVTAISMVVTPVLLVIYEIVQKFTMKNVEVPKQKPDEIHSKHDVILIGFGHFGSTIGRFLRANGISATILDSDPDRVTMLRKMGFNVYFGDGTDVDLLHAAGAEKAKYLIATVDPPSVNQQIISLVSKHFPHIEIIARAKNRYDAYELLDMGLQSIYRETLYTAVHLAVDLLTKLGVRAYTAERKGQDFITFDESAMKKLANDRHDTKQYILNVREQIELQEKLLSEDLHFTLTQHDSAWDSEALIKNSQPKQTS